MKIRHIKNGKFTHLKFTQPVLPFLALPLLVLSAHAQTASQAPAQLPGQAPSQLTGVSHPDQTIDASDAPTAAPASSATSDHYVMPSHATAQAPSDSQPAASIYPATGTPSETSFAATGPVPSSETPVPAPPTQPQQTYTEPRTPALIVRQPLPATSPTDGGYTPRETAAYVPEPGHRPGPDDGVVQVELVPYQLNEGVVLRTRLDSPISTETTRPGMPFSARITADAGHSGEVILPAGSVIHGRITSIHGGNRITGGASVHLQTDSVTLPDGTTYPLHATLAGLDSEEQQHVNDEGSIQPTTHPKETAVVLGSVTGAGAIMGAALGGGVGAGVGALVGAGAGAIFWLKQDQQEMVPAGTGLLFSLDTPLQLTPR